MATPLISIVIPTYGRPKYLPLAVNSALKSSPDSVEVIVVPNGSDDSWKESMRVFAQDSRIRVAPIDIGHANLARNHGMSLASGKYLRFLDDDDFLHPLNAISQCQLLEKTGAEICSGGLDLCSSDEIVFKTAKQPETTDFVQSVLSSNRLTATLSHLYLRKSLSGIIWDPSIDLGQDTHWINLLCQRKEWRWERVEEIAGTWRHHAGPRISSNAKTAQHYRVSGEYLLKTVKSLIGSGRLTPERARAASEGMWFGIHGAFFLNPAYWWRYAQETQRLFPDSRPDLDLYRTPIGRIVPPLLVESAMIPKRWLNHSVRRWKVRHGRLPPW